MPQVQCGRSIWLAYSNLAVSTPPTVHPFTGKPETSGLQFRRGDLNKLLLPLSLTSCDLEAFLHDPTPVEGRSHPSGAEKVHSIFAYSLAHTSLHDHLPLPPDLAAPRGMCYNPATESQDQFMLSFLFTLRDDAKKLSRFYADAFERDPGPLKVQNFSQDQKLRWALNKRCIFCGNLFYSFKFKRTPEVRAVSTFRKFSIVRTKIKVLPARDHDHLQLNANLRA